MIKYTNSPLSLNRFSVLAFQLVTIPGKEYNIKKKPPNLKLEIDYDILHSKAKNYKNQKYKIIIKLDGKNKKNSKEKFSFSLVAESIFSFSKNLDKEEIDQYLLYSALPIIINNVRVYLMNVLSFSPYESFILPTVDLRDLIEKKIKKNKKNLHS